VIVDPNWVSQGSNIYYIQSQNQPFPLPSQPAQPTPFPGPSQSSQPVLDWQDDDDDDDDESGVAAVSVQPRRRVPNRQGLRQLSDDDKLTALRIAVRRQDAYQSAGVSDKKFWKAVADEVAQLNGRPAHKSLSRTIAKLVREREREKEASGSQEGRSDLLIVLDDWIDVVRSRRAADDARATRKTRLDGEAAEAIAFRQSQLSLWTDRRLVQSVESSQPSPAPSTPSQDPETLGLPRRKRRRKADETASEDQFDKDFRRLVDCYVSRSASHEGEGNSARIRSGGETGEGSGESNRLEAVEGRLGKLEEGVSQILQILRG
jgi:hypothetical protein